VPSSLGPRSPENRSECQREEVLGAPGMPGGIPAKHLKGTCESGRDRPTFKEAASELATRAAFGFQAA
jgi:hypothetical protein